MKKTPPPKKKELVWNIVSNVAQWREATQHPLTMTHAPQRWENGLPDRSPTFLPAIGADQRDLKALNVDIYKKWSFIIFIEITWNNTKWRFLIFSYPNFSSWVESKICHNKSDIVTSYDNIYWTSTCFIAQLHNKLSQLNPLGSSMKKSQIKVPQGVAREAKR